MIDQKMSFSAEESSPVAFVSDPCCICDEEFESDLELTNHLLEHCREEHFKNLLAEKEKLDKMPTPKKPVHRGRAPPEFITTDFLDEIKRKKSFIATSAPGEPEVLEILSSDEDEPDPKKVKTSPPFVPPSFSQSNSGKSPANIVYRCKQCSMVLPSIKAFQEHLAIHDKPRPYVCHICKKSFAYKGTLRQHLHLHISERAHECQVCHKKFTMKSLLRQHEETHHGKSEPTEEQKTS